MAKLSQTHLLITVSLVFFITLLCFSSTFAQRFQEPCFQPDHPCDAVANLYCSSTGFCECQFPWMVFHQAKRLCQVSAGHECSTGSNLMCTENASCVTEGEKNECACDEDYEQCNAVGEGLSGTEEELQTKVCCLKNSSEES